MHRNAVDGKLRVGAHGDQKLPMPSERNADLDLTGTAATKAVDGELARIAPGPQEFPWGASGAAWAIPLS